MDDILTKLCAPFPPDQINWKAQAVSDDKTRALAVPYIDARDVAERLDMVVGPMNWQVDHKAVGDQTMTGIGIKSPDNGFVWKWDIGLVDREGQEAMSAKGSLSDGLKRAAVLWGIGRYLYRFPGTWVGYDAKRKRLTEVPKIAGPEAHSAKPEVPKPVAEGSPSESEKPKLWSMTNTDHIAAVRRARVLPPGDDHAAHIVNILNASKLDPATDAPKDAVVYVKAYHGFRESGANGEEAHVKAMAYLLDNRGK